MAFSENFKPFKSSQLLTYGNYLCTKSLLDFFGSPHLRGSKIHSKMTKNEHFSRFSNPLNGTKYVPNVIAHIPKDY